MAYKIPQNNRHICKLQHSNESFKITFCWMDIYFGSYISVSNTGNFSKNPCFHTKLCTVYAFILTVSCLLVTQIWTLKPGDVMDFPAKRRVQPFVCQLFFHNPQGSADSPSEDALQHPGVDRNTLGAPGEATWARVAARSGMNCWIPSRGLTYPTYWKRKIIFNMPFLMGYVSSLKGNYCFLFGG